MIRRSDDAVSASTRRSIAILIVGGAALAAAFLGASPADAANPSISVSPSTGLRAGQTVTVAGSGFTKNAQVYIVECVAGASSENQCSFDFSDLSTVVLAKADGSGNVHASSPVLKSSFKTTDCTKVACEIAAHQTISFTLSAANTATHTISFGAASHPTSSHAAASGAPHSSIGAAAGSTAAGASTLAAASTSASTITAGGASSAAGSTAATTSGVAGSPGASSGGSAVGGAAPSSTARTIKTKAKNGGRYAVVAIVGVIAVLFVGAMAASGRRRRS